jgi:hypothetical protein
MAEENTYKQLSYLDLGFSSFLTRNSISPKALIDPLENYFSNRNITDMSIDKLTAGTINVAANLGGAGLVLDGPNIRIIVNDGTTDRGVIGKLI